MADELTRSARLIEQLLGDPALRARFRCDPAAVLREGGLGGLAGDLPAGERAMVTLELRESRSSLAGVIVAAAAEGVDFGQVAEHAAPRLGREAGSAITQLVKRLSPSHHAATPAPRHAPVHHAPPAPAHPRLAPAGPLPEMARRPVHHAPVPARPAPDAPVRAAPEHAVSMPLEAPDPLQYPGADATPRQIAAWMGANARRAGLPAELPVMAALTESGMRNLDYGDRDSVGFFQMRVGIWDQGAYAGFPGDPDLQLKWFIDEAVAARRDDPGLAAGPSSWGEWVADVERPAAEYRYRYQLQLEQAQELLRGARGAGDAGAPPVDHEPLGHRVTRAASACLGAPCAPQGADMRAGFDGPGLVRFAYARQGVQLPRTAAEQFDVGAAVPRSKLQPGDAVFFGSAHDRVQDVGLYVGDGRVVTASGRREAVSLASLDGASLHYLGARRYSEKLLTGPGSYARTLPTVSRSGAPSGT